MHINDSPSYLHALLKDLMFSSGYEDCVIAKAKGLHRRACAIGRLRERLASIVGLDLCLIDLSTMKETASVQGWHYAGVQTVPIKEVVGTEHNNCEFDRAFYPLRFHDEKRWLQVAISQFAGLQLTPIELIHIQHKYFVQSGHYRISVAQMFDLNAIRAYVTHWETKRVSKD